MKIITDIILHNSQVLYRTSIGEFLIKHPEGDFEYVDGPTEGLKKFAVMGKAILSNTGDAASVILKEFNTLDEAQRAKHVKPALYSRRPDAPVMWHWKGEAPALASPELWIQEIY